MDKNIFFHYKIIAIVKTQIPIIKRQIAINILVFVFILTLLKE